MPRLDEVISLFVDILMDKLVSLFVLPPSNGGLAEAYFVGSPLMSRVLPRMRNIALLGIARGLMNTWVTRESISVCVHPFQTRKMGMEMITGIVGGVPTCGVAIGPLLYVPKGHFCLL
uniref:Uncharacterized protein n=1 Tax=Opuntia streptacantha TaxID=393608 RepID=A0A7C8ZT76_OPUST